MKTRAFYVAPPREFPLSVRATFEPELQIFTHKFTPLSIDFADKEVEKIKKFQNLVDVTDGSPPWRRQRKTTAPGRDGSSE